MLAVGTHLIELLPRTEVFAHGIQTRVDSRPDSLQLFTCALCRPANFNLTLHAWGRGWENTAEMTLDAMQRNWEKRYAYSYV